MISPNFGPRTLPKREEIHLLKALGHQMEMEGYGAYWSCTNCGHGVGRRESEPIFHPLEKEDGNKCQYCTDGTPTHTVYVVQSWGQKEGHNPICPECIIKRVNQWIKRDQEWLQEVLAANEKCNPINR